MSRVLFNLHSEAKLKEYFSLVCCVMLTTWTTDTANDVVRHFRQIRRCRRWRRNRPILNQLTIHVYFLRSCLLRRFLSHSFTQSIALSYNVSAATIKDQRFFSQLLIYEWTISALIERASKRNSLSVSVRWKPNGAGVTRNGTNERPIERERKNLLEAKKKTIRNLKIITSVCVRLAGENKRAKRWKMSELVFRQIIKRWETVGDIKCDFSRLLQIRNDNSRRTTATDELHETTKSVGDNDYDDEQKNKDEKFFFSLNWEWKIRFENVRLIIINL